MENSLLFYYLFIYLFILMLRSNKGHSIDGHRAWTGRGVAAPRNRALFDLLGVLAVGVAAFSPRQLTVQEYRQALPLQQIILAQLYFWASWRRDCSMMPPCRWSTRCSVNSFWVL